MKKLNAAVGEVAWIVFLGAVLTAGGTPTIVDPNGPNSGAGRHPFSGEATSGPGRAHLQTWGTGPIHEPGHPNSGSGRLSVPPVF